MTQIVFASLVALALCAGSCGVRNNAMDKVDSQDCLGIDSAAYQDHFPGVYSNLRSTRSYKVYLKHDCDSEIKLISILTEDVELPVQSARQGDAYLSAPVIIPPGKSELVVFTARSYYNEDGPVMHEPTVYTLSGRDLPGKFVLVYEVGGKLMETPVTALKVNESINHP